MFADYVNINYSNGKITGTISNRLCEHKNGWFGSVDFILFGFVINRKQVFCCIDCGAFISKKDFDKKWKNQTTHYTATLSRD